LANLFPTTMGTYHNLSSNKINSAINSRAFLT
jgi:hypothetical protein